MPVYDYTYKTWTGVRRGPLFRWLAIPKFTYMDYTKNRIFIGLIILASMQFVVRLFYMYIAVNLDLLQNFGIDVSGSRLPPIDAGFFKNYIDTQLPFCFVFAFMLGAGLISRDLKHNALVLYASKPISRWEYFFGKFSVLFVLVMAITWLQAILLFLIQIVISPPDGEWRTQFWSQYAWIAVPITTYSLLIAAGMSLLILAASSLTKNSHYAGATFAAFIVGSAIVGGFMREVLNDNSFSIVSPLRIGIEAGAYLFGMNQSRDLSVMETTLGIAALLGGASLILYWNLSRAARTGH